MTSDRDGLQLEYERMLAISDLQQTYGRWSWRWRAPIQDRLALRLTPAAERAITRGTHTPSILTARVSGLSHKCDDTGEQPTAANPWPARRLPDAPRAGQRPGTAAARSPP